MAVIAVVQARMGSSRLRGKVLLPAAGKPLLAHLVERLGHSRYLDEVVLATSTQAGDDFLADFASERRLRIFRGSETDVLDRYYQAARDFRADPIVRVTGDCPLIDPAIVDRVIGEFLNGKYDYVSTNHPATFPDGLDTEVFSFASLQAAWQEASIPYELEHVTPYLWDNPDRFRIGNVENGEDLSQVERWTLDYEEDYRFIRAIFEELYEPGRWFTMKDVLALLRRKPHLRKINDMHLGVNWYAGHWSELKTKASLRTSGAEGGTGTSGNRGGASEC